ncbi:MAG: M81 family metallopeptidase [Planctomycetia bacterium]|nr:M81 family metallopeptidase [Planctomycetia bacterium]
MPHRVLIAGLFHETHTFLAGRTALEDFDLRRGDKLLSAEGDGSPLGGTLDVAKSQGWDIIPVIDLRATPGPVVEDRVFDLFWNDVLATIDREEGRGIDGVCLVLHGAMVSQSLLDVEGEILERLRKRMGDEVPVCGVLDLHGNCTAKMALNSHGFVAYRQNPHADACAAARDGALILDRLMRTGERPTTVWERPAVMWPPTGTGTAFDPMKTLEAMARQIEEVHEEILAVNVFAGFSFADMPDTGVSFTAVTLGEPRYARAELEELSEWTVANRALGNVREDPLDQVLARIKSGSRESHPPTHVGGSQAGFAKPIVLAEPSDNIGGGAPGDGVDLLRALVNAGIDNAAVAINDPQAVAALGATRPGERVTLAIGGRGAGFGDGPFQAEFEFVSRSDGRFALEDPHSHLASMCGSKFDMGPCAVVRHRGVTILLTTHKTPPFDLGQWRSQGIEPEKLSVIAVKAAVAHRRVYDPIAGAHYTVETPGPCSSNLQTFPFRHVRRPIYPLDE